MDIFPNTVTACYGGTCPFGGLRRCAHLTRSAPRPLLRRHLPLRGIETVNGDVLILRQGTLRRHLPLRGIETVHYNQHLRRDLKSPLLRRHLPLRGIETRSSLVGDTSFPVLRRHLPLRGIETSRFPPRFPPCLTWLRRHLPLRGIETCTSF